MTIDECKSCVSHKRFENGSVHCGYYQNIVSMTTVFNPKLKAYVLLSCPKEKKDK
jgi:hypothetical protein